MMNFAHKATSSHESHRGEAEYQDRAAQRTRALAFFELLAADPACHALLADNSQRLAVEGTVIMTACDTERRAALSHVTRGGHPDGLGLARSTWILSGPSRLSSTKHARREAGAAPGSRRVTFYV